jgi:hypothetical protein
MSMVLRSEIEVRKERENLINSMYKNPTGSRMASLKAKINILTWVLKEEKD